VSQPFAAEAERRLSTRVPVNERATIQLGNVSSAIQCSLMDLSLDGCRVRTDTATGAESGERVEMTFRLAGMAFRLGGVTEWCAPTREIGVLFSGLSPRREAELVEALGELAEKLEAKRAEAARAGDAIRAMRETVELLTAELNAKRSREAQARAEAEQAAREARQAQEKLDAAKRDLSQAEKAEAELARSLPNVIESVTVPDKPAATADKPMPAAGTQPARQTGRERRQSQRHAVDSSATIFLVDVRSNVRGRIVDVSMSGCRIRVAEKFPVGIYRRVEVEFLLDGLAFRLPGVVQSLHDRLTVGIRFVDLSERKREQLLSVIDEMAEAAGEGEAQAG